MLWGSTIANAQRIKWQRDRPLSWTDFKGRPDHNSNMVAVSYWNTYYTFKRELIDSIYVFSFNIENSFDSKASWVKWRYTDNEHLLGHEQLHFDINEIFTRKLASALYSTTFTENYRSEIEALYKKHQAESAAMESKYDTETEHSNNSYIQSQWQLYVDHWLKINPRNY